ncbi:hypothetical protein MGA3_15126 [Bacillus methanolicus MGA3]|uniref:Uncharacterized protein n=1 Tax=Bacillus methanolicus (strain MGA3 / ATCC 53907) TaxID=796606 RepID=I3DZM6_BACMM|nr:hypothetical protein BMMGA3_06670 [Bacillus methanolicus MGA3]EIJ79697.1 hypothetical protein MGA3_15126 [Bacillus methanolicus MGA3]
MKDNTFIPIFVAFLGALAVWAAVNIKKKKNNS